MEERVATMGRRRMRERRVESCRLIGLDEWRRILDGRDHRSGLATARQVAVGRTVVPPPRDWHQTHALFIGRVGEIDGANHGVIGTERQLA